MAENRLVESDAESRCRGFRGGRSRHEWARGRSRGRYGVGRTGERVRETEEQDDELLALSSIYDPDVFIVDKQHHCGRFMAHVELPESFSISRVEDNGSVHDLPIKNLPPIELFFTFPCNYPSTKKPYFRLLCKWLNTEQLLSLCKQLDEIWYKDKGVVVLFKWTVFLKEDSLRHLGIRDVLDLAWINQRMLRNYHISDLKSSISSQRTSRAENPVGVSSQSVSYKSVNKNIYLSRCVIQDVRSLATLIPEILEYDERKKEEIFQKSYLKCNICFEEKSGAKCIRFKGCEHSFCQNCVKSYFEINIKEGNVQCLNCPSEKCTSKATPSQVRESVGAELFKKYDDMLLATTLDTMSDVIYCPRMSCQSAVILDSGSNVASCPSCFFSFCCFCLMAYHGIEPCKLHSADRLALYEKYNNGTASDKSAIEARYGKTQIKHLVEAVLTENWVNANSKICPHCKAQIEKADGCNKMTCWKCNTFFCWLCMKKLNRDTPYSHYDVKDNSSECAGRLFHGTVDIDDEDDDFEYYEDDDDYF